MYGLPINLKTRADFENIYNLAISGKVNKDKALLFFNRLKSNMHYVFDRVLGETEDPDGTEPDYKVIETEDERIQYRLEANSAALIYKIGYTESELQSKINELEEI